MADITYRKKTFENPLILLREGYHCGIPATGSFRWEEQVKVIWVRLSTMDNAPAHFRKRMLCIARHWHRGLEPSLADVPLPGRSAGETLGLIRRVLAEGEGPPVLLVFEHLHRLEPGPARDLLAALAKASLAGTQVILFPQSAQPPLENGMGCVKALLHNFQAPMGGARGEQVSKCDRDEWKAGA